MKTDFIYDDQGSVIALRPLTDQARSWCELNLLDDGDTILIEHRFFEAIAEGIAESKLSLRQEKPPPR